MFVSAICSLSSERRILRCIPERTVSHETQRRLTWQLTSSLSSSTFARSASSSSIKLVGTLAVSETLLARTTAC